MPSPLAHAAAAYAIYRLSGPMRPDAPETHRDRVIRFLATAGFSFLPDFDVVPGLWAGDIGRYHYQQTHSLIAALAVTLGAGLLASRWRRGAGRSWAALAGVCYGLHLLMDVLTQGRRGVMLFWPLSTDRFQSPVTVFHGLQYSQHWTHPTHWVTLTNELTFTLLVLLGLWLRDRRLRRRPSAAPPGTKRLRGSS